MSRLQLPPKLDERALAGRLAATGAVLLVLAVAVAMVADQGPRSRSTTRALVVADNVSALAAGFGSLWAADDTGGRIVRVDARRRTVQARIAAPQASNVAVGLGAVWANAHGTLLKIDPRTDRVRGRVPIETPDGVPYKTFDVVPTSSAVWLVQPDRALRLDPRTLGLRGSSVLTQNGAEAQAWAGDRDALWTVTALGLVQRYDSRTGKRLASLPSPLAAPTAIAVADGAVAILDADGNAARIDPVTGGAVWRARLGLRAGAVGASGRFLFVKGADPTRPRDVLLKIDLATGRVVSRMPMADLGSDGRIGVIGGEAWMSVFGGKLVAARI